ncbi:hypothetical protein CDAR_596621 [Caerostris darwini]|uniref:Uncharacterized protein n=1 Tax=Caerostris darwini TaxID=1538125 RepID=A0AAV4WFT8_9ARAC|nr:hypothetical protein CDAR_596621 [Caerostris darwini]
MPSIRFDLGERGGEWTSIVVLWKEQCGKKMTPAFHRREWGFKKKRIQSALSDNKGDEWSRFDPLCDVVRAVCGSPLWEGRVDNFPHSNQVPSIQFDLYDGLPSSFSGNSTAERKCRWRSVVKNGASRRKEYYPPCRTIRETNGPVLFHCATSSEPFISFNAPESDGPPRACQKVCNIPLFVLLFSQAKKLLPDYDVRKESNTANKLVVTVWDPLLNVL